MLTTPQSTQVRSALEDEALEQKHGASWHQAAVLVNLPSVNEAIQALVDDSTEDNAIGVIVAVLDALCKPVMVQEFNEQGLHRLVCGSQKTNWASYRSFTFLNGMVGVTDYYTGNGEKILTTEQFCQLAGVREEQNS